ncbi:MAG: hypothetical protein ACRC7O_08270, partial [Fimbriiglobus sp.]
MPLLDHFHPPVLQRHNWVSFHNLWAAAILERLNGSLLAKSLFAEMTVRMSRGIEVDVATLHNPYEEEDEPPEFGGTDNDSGGGTAVAVAPAVASAWAPPTVELEADTVFPDSFEVRVFSTSAGRTLVGAIELVSPGNKDRPEVRRAFAAKVASYLHRKVGVVVVDIVTSRLPNLHDAVCDELGLGPPFRFAADPTTYAVAYRPVRREEAGEFHDRIQMWRYPLTVGGPLPTMPLGLRNLGIVP